MTREPAAKHSMLTLTWASFVVGTTAGAVLTLGSYVRREILRRGYPSWERCHCDFKARESFFQVWHSQHEQRGETIFAEEWGTHLSNPPQWLRRFFHHSSQVLAALNPGGNYVERVVLSPQEALQLEIGRASCRERVEIAVVSLSFKKKNGGSTTRSRV